MSNEPTMNPMSVSEVARWLGVSEERIRQFLRQGRLPNAWRRGRRGWWRIPRADVEALVAQRSKGRTRETTRPS